MEVSYEVLFPDVLVHAPNCPEPTVINAIRNACIEMANETLCLTEDMDPLSTVAGEALVEIYATAGYDVVQLVGDLHYKGRRLEKSNYLELDAAYSRSWASLSGEPQGYIQYRPTEVRLIPIPVISESAVITGHVALAPSRISTRCRDDLITLNREAIAAGALARILMVPDQPYTNEAKAGVYHKIFRSAVANAAATVRTSFNRAPMRVIPKKFW